VLIALDERDGSLSILRRGPRGRMTSEKERSEVEGWFYLRVNEIPSILRVGVGTTSQRSVPHNKTHSPSLAFTYLVSSPII
jgi:hypothetical protein